MEPIAVAVLTIAAVLSTVVAAAGAIALTRHLEARRQHSTRIFTSRIDEVQAAADRAAHDRARDDLFLHPYAEHIRDNREED